jgi:hypothetical protein
MRDSPKAAAAKLELYRFLRAFACGWQVGRRIIQPAMTHIRPVQPEPRLSQHASRGGFRTSVTAVFVVTLLVLLVGDETMVSLTYVPDDAAEPYRGPARRTGICRHDAGAVDGSMSRRAGIAPSRSRPTDIDFGKGGSVPDIDAACASERQKRAALCIRTFRH